MATSQDPLAWRRQFCKGQWKEQEGEEDSRRDGKITSRNGREWGLEIPWGQRKTGKDGKVLVPRRPPRLRDWYGDDCSFEVFLNCNKRMFSNDKDVFLSFVYLPPQGSPFYNNLDFRVVMPFEDVFVSLPICDKYFIIMGDFNSRKGELKDIFEIF